MEHVLKILTLAEKSERIGILLGPEAKDTELLAAHALKERLGEKATILNAPDNLQDRWSHLFKKDRPRKEFALALNIEENPVDELRYEKEGGKLRILLFPRNRLTKEAFELEERYPASDMIIALGFAEETGIARAIEIDAPLKNPDALINLSAQKNAVPSSRQWDIGAMKLWSRAILRSYTEENGNVFWAFLPKEDFQKTGQSDGILPLLITDMRLVTALPPLCCLLWQDQEQNARVHVLISGTDQNAMERLSQAAETPLIKGNLCIRGFSNFSEAEVETRKLLKNL